MTYIASRLSVVQSSASMAVSQDAKALRAKGIDVIDLSLGEPDFATPAHIVEAAYEAGRSGDTLYTAAAGTLALRQAIAAKFARENGLDYDAHEIVVANGAKQIIFNAFLATLEPGDEVILPAPYFVSYPEIVKLLSGSPIIVDCPEEAGLRLTPTALENAITPRTKWLLLNLPGNPSGVVYSEAELKALGEVLARHEHVLVMSDEIYEHILFDGRAFISFGKACPDLKSRTLIINGVSKAYAMTGWRVGYAAGPRLLLGAMTTIQSQACTSVCSIAQAAAAAALAGPQDHISHFREAFERRRNLVVSAIDGIDGLSLPPPEGAFYAFINCAGLIGLRTPDGAQLSGDAAVAQYLLTEGRVAAVPGVAYGMSPYVRISTATSDELLGEAMKRIASAVARLDPKQAVA